MSRRIDLLNNLSFLEDNHCVDCELKTKQNLSTHQYAVYCFDYCKVGKRMQEIRKELDPSTRKMKYTKLDAETKSKITGMYQFKTPKQIAEKLELNYSAVSRFLVKWVKEKKITLDHYKYDTRRIIELDHQGLTIDEIVAKTKESKRKVTGTLEREYKRQREGFGRHE